MPRSKFNVSSMDYPAIARQALRVEHPAAIEAVDELRQWWPGIGIAADHPLTDYFIMKRRRGLRFSRVPVGQIVWSAAWIGGLVTLVSVYYYYVSFIILGLCLVERALHKIIFKKNVGEIADPIDILEERTLVKMEQLYLAPIHFMNLLGASAVVYYRHWKRYAAGLVLLLFVVMAFFLAIIQWYVARRFHQYVQPLNVGTIIIFVSIGSVVCRPTFIIAVGMRNLYAKLIEKTGKNNMQRESLVMEHLWIALPFTLLFSFAVLYFIRFFWVWLIVVVVACVWQCRLAVRQLDSVVESNYVRYAREGETYYRNLFKAEEKSEIPKF